MLLFAESICRIFFLLSPRVSLHLDGFGRVVRHCSGLGMVQTQLEGRFKRKSVPLTYIRRTMERRRIPVATYDIQPKHCRLCADIICGDSGYLRTTFHLQFPAFLHSICAAETSEPLISIKL